MTKINFLIIILPLSFLIAALDKQPISKSNIENQKIENPKRSSRILETWDHDDANIENADYKREIENLKNEFNQEKQSIIDNYNIKIESLRTQRENSMNQLRENFSDKRKTLRKKHGIRNKTDRPIKKANNNKDSSDKVSKKKSMIVQPLNKEQPINGKKPIKPNNVLKEDVKEVPKKSKK